MGHEDPFRGLDAASILKARNIRRLVYFHSDHYEPWRFVPGRKAAYELALGDVERYVEMSAARELGRRATLFYKANVNYVIDPSRDLHRGHPADPVGLALPEGRMDRLSQQILGALTGDEREIQVHIHHENITWNDRIRDEAMRAHLADPAHRVYDDLRFERLVQLNLDLLHRQAGLDPTRWFFVHGHWALNASDPHECTIVREIEILRRQGCLGDFTQPAGRPHTDSRAEQPYLVRPVPLAKGYDRPEAEPVPAAGAGVVPADRFLIWASEIAHRDTSIDHYSGFVRERMKEPTAFARANAARGFAHDGVLYVKTHAHSLHPAYWRKEGGAGAFPHAHDGILRELSTLFEAAGAAGAEVEFATVSEVFDRLMAASPAEPVDLVAAHGLGDGEAMAQVGCDVAFVDATGADRPAPSLAPEPLGPAPMIPSTGEPVTGRPWATVVELQLPAGGPNSTMIAVDHGALTPIVAALTPLAKRTVAGRDALLGDDTGIENPAPPSIFVHNEGGLAALLEESGADRAAPVVHIGCGLGTLPLLLAARGWTAIGIDRSEERIAHARAIAAEAEAEGLIDRAPFFHVGLFPVRVPKLRHLDRGTVIVTGIISDDGMEGQAAFVRELTGFRTAIVDLARLFVPRDTPSDQRRLLDLFEQVGFGNPRYAGSGLPGSVVVLDNRHARGWRGWLRWLKGRVRTRRAA